MIKVLLEQQVIPPYRIPFFSGLSKKVDLTVLTSDNVSISGVTDVKENLPFKTIRAIEKKNNGGYPLHENLINLMKNHGFNVYISNSEFLSTYGTDPRLRNKLIDTGCMIIWWGCDGYDNRNFFLAKLSKTWINKLPRRSRWPYLFSDPEKTAIGLTDGFLAYSSYTGEYWQNVFNVPPQKISIAHNAVDVTNLCKETDLLINEGIKQTPQSILFVGRMTQGKHLDILIRAFKIIKSRFPSASLNLVGDGSVKPDIELLSKKLKLSDVFFHQETWDQYELARIMRSSSLFVMPGLGGLGLNSAMACGLPIVCTLADGTELDLVQEGRNGWFFQNGNYHDLAGVIMKVITEEDVLVCAGKKSRQLIDTKFNLETMINAFVQRINAVHR
jgi:glycosyltransferase involved in cell wall biosynthesis